MRTIVAGSRSIEDYDVIVEAITQSGFEVTTVISGTARGVDSLGEEWAYHNNVDVERHPANWDKHGKSAGYKRNEEMAMVADALVAIWDGKSRGTMHMINLARKHGLKVYVHQV